MPHQNLVGVIYLKATLCLVSSRVKHDVVRWPSGDRNKVLVVEGVGIKNKRR